MLGFATKTQIPQGYKKHLNGTNFHIANGFVHKNLYFLAVKEATIKTNERKKKAC